MCKYVWLMTGDFIFSKIQKRKLRLGGPHRITKCVSSLNIKTNTKIILCKNNKILQWILMTEIPDDICPFEIRLNKYTWIQFNIPVAHPKYIENKTTSLIFLTKSYLYSEWTRKREKKSPHFCHMLCGKLSTFVDLKLLLIIVIMCEARSLCSVDYYFGYVQYG